MIHYLDKVTRRFGNTKHQCLCLNGGYEENFDHNLTLITARINCAACLSILKVAKELNISLYEARQKYIDAL